MTVSSSISSVHDDIHYWYYVTFSYINRVWYINGILYVHYLSYRDHDDLFAIITSLKQGTATDHQWVEIED